MQYGSTRLSVKMQKGSISKVCECNKDLTRFLGKNELFICSESGKRAASNDIIIIKIGAKFIQ